MKKSLLLLLLLSGAPAVVSAGTQDGLAPLAAEGQTTAQIVKVTQNTESGIENARYTATLADGTVLGFQATSSSAEFCGAISNQQEIIVPDSLAFGGSWGNVAVNYVGYGDNVDFDDAQSVTSLVLPRTIERIYALPSTVKVLHTNSYIDNVYSTDLSGLEKVMVPKEHLSTYYDATKWSNYVLINEEGTEPVSITVNVAKAGEFAQLLLQQTDNWYKVNKLTVTGTLNSDDLDVFKRMRQLTGLDLSRAVITDIPDQFDGAYNYTSNSRQGFNLLEELILPEVNSIGQCAFAQCTRLKSVTMPKVNTVGRGAFALLGANRIVLPEGITSVGDYAFYGSQLESIEIPSSLTQIGEYCFQNCSSMKSAVLPASVGTINAGAFSQTGLTSISLPGVKTIGSSAFWKCKQLSDVRFAEGLTDLGASSFGGCTALTEIDLPSTFASEYRSFSDCSNLKKVTCRAVTPPSPTNGQGLMEGCDMTDVKLYVPAMSIDQYRAMSGWKTFYTILPMEDKTSNLYVYDTATIDSADEFASGCNLTIDYKSQYRNGSNSTYCGALDYNGSSTLSLHNYQQNHYLGYYDSYFTSLIPNGTMRADNVLTTLQTNDTYTWYFISLPYDVKVADITYTDGTQFAIRKYSGLNRAQGTGSTWLNLTTDSIMHAYEGYILRCNKENAAFTFPALNNTNKNKVFEKESVEVALGEYVSEFDHNRSWNLIGNPYPCYYDTRCMDFTAPITVWNRNNKRYDAYSPVDDEYVLHPAQSFFVQRPVDKGSVTFDKAGRQKDAVAADSTQSLQANAKRLLAARPHRTVYNVLMSHGADEDHTRFVVNDEATCAYELDKDASKFVTDDNAGLLVYTIEDGVKYAINERPMAEGTVSLGFYAPTEGEYTISLRSARNANIILFDNEANTRTALTGDYRFSTTAGYHNSRFTLLLSDATGINAVPAEDNAAEADTPYTVYTVDGRLVGTYSAQSKPSLAKGIYVIVSKDVKRKITVK